MMKLKEFINIKNIKDEFVCLGIGDKESIIKKIVNGNDFYIRGERLYTFSPFRYDKKIGTAFSIDINTGNCNDFSMGKGGSIIDLIMATGYADPRDSAKYLSKLMSLNTSTKQCLNYSELSQQFCDKTQDIPSIKEIEKYNFIWKQSSADGSHPYLEEKQIQIGNAKINKAKGYNSIVIPLVREFPKNLQLKIESLQYISCNKDGGFNKIFSGSMKGLFYIASDYKASKDYIFIAEGYATAQSIALCTEYTVIACMSSNNMECVSLLISKLVPNSIIVLCADNDDAGRNCANSVSGILQNLGIKNLVVSPEDGNDFNDMLVATTQTYLNNFLKKKLSKKDRL